MATSIKNNSNTKIYNRNIPSTIMESYFRIVPENSRYQDMNENLQAVNRHHHVIQSSKNHQPYEQSDVFNPGTSAPWAGYLSAVNTESVLRNQIYANSKNNMIDYVPSSQSDLFVSNSQVPFNNNNNNVYSYLQQQDQTFSNTFYNNKIGYMMFNNCTRNQLKDTV